MKKTLYLCADGVTVEGPWPQPELEALIQARGLPRDVPCCVEGEEKWEPYQSWLNRTLLCTVLLYIAGGLIALVVLVLSAANLGR